jgi:hypothetical protein
MVIGKYVDWTTGSGEEQVVVSCELGNEPKVSIKSGRGISGLAE